MEYNLPTTIRVHHLPPLVYPLTLDEWGKILIHDKFIKNVEDPFLNLVYSTFQKLRENPQHKLMVISGEKDILCTECSKRTACYGPQSLKYMILLDDYYLKKIGFTAGDEYSIARIINSVHPNVGGWLDEIIIRLNKQ